MRRFLAITAIAALILSTGLPVWATACTAMNHGKDKTPMCHRTAAHHHCETMTEQQGEAAATDPDMVFSGRSEECPMQCCMQAQAGHGTAVLAVSFLPELVVSDYQSDAPIVVFVSSGFSSHTDRGPPAL